MTDEISLADLDEECRRLVWTRMSVRFALGCLEDFSTPERIANAMAIAIEGPYSDELAEKWVAFATGIGSLKGSPVPCRASFCWGTA